MEEKTLHIDQHSQNNERHLLELVIEENYHNTQNNVIRWNAADY